MSRQSLYTQPEHPTRARGDVFVIARFYPVSSECPHASSYDAPSGEGAGRGRDGRGQQRVAHEVLVDASGTRSALGDGPHDEALTATHVAAREDARHRRHE